MKLIWIQLPTSAQVWLKSVLSVAVGGAIGAVTDMGLTAAHVVYWGSQSDTTQRAVFYYSRPLKAPPTKKDGTCAWGSVEHCVDIGGLSFWREA